MRKFCRVMSALASNDGRAVRVLPSSERNAIPIERRGFLEGVQRIAGGVMAPTYTSRLAAPLDKMDFR